MVVVKHSSVLVFGRLLHAVDHEHVNGTLRRFQPEPELFLNGREDRRAVGRWRRWFGTTGHDGTAREFRGPLQLEIVETLQARLIDDRPPQLLGQA